MQYDENNLKHPLEPSKETCHMPYCIDLEISFQMLLLCCSVVGTDFAQRLETDHTDDDDDDDVLNLFIVCATSTIET